MVYVDIKASNNKNKKLMAIFFDDNMKKIKTTHFGTVGYSDYTIHKDSERKQRYIERHQKREDWSDYKSAGSLSRYILWEKPKLRDSINYYIKKFNLKLIT